MMPFDLIQPSRPKLKIGKNGNNETKATIR